MIHVISYFRIVDATVSAIHHASLPKNVCDGLRQINDGHWRDQPGPRRR